MQDGDKKRKQIKEGEKLREKLRDDIRKIKTDILVIDESLFGIAVAIVNRKIKHLKLKEERSVEEKNESGTSKGKGKN